MVNFGGFFPKLGHFAGFSLHIITFAVRISEAAMGGLHIVFIFLGCREAHLGCGVAQEGAA